MCDERSDGPSSGVAVLWRLWCGSCLRVLAKCGGYCRGYGDLAADDAARFTSSAVAFCGQNTRCCIQAGSLTVLGLRTQATARHCWLSKPFAFPSRPVMPWPRRWPPARLSASAMFFADHAHVGGLRRSQVKLEPREKLQAQWSLPELGLPSPST
ncbi:hypothetical protein BT67DRAFT_439618 [Trichocladium antarcticum]|uniref:Uncharacterized protein n=1 Tax=Trichocladium antarcticum TaxID=1450529 RepID=A0AAN6UPF2_9PEZI|nr:hypothetical protein BT67DRAFT_439618 [Trichocladium antarcticum]